MMELIPDWKQAYKFASMKLMGLASVFGSVWIMIPDDLRHRVPDSWAMGILVSMTVLGMIGRIVQKPEPHE